MALASWEPMAGRLIVQQVHDHQGQHGQGTVPLPAIDAWEHATTCSTRTGSPTTSRRSGTSCSWPDVERRYEMARVADIVPT